MEEMRITLKIEGGDKEFRVSGNITEIRAIEYFEMLCSEIRISNKFHKSIENNPFNLQGDKHCMAEIEEDKDEDEEEEGDRKSLYAKVFELIDEKGPISTKEIAEAFEKDTFFISTYVSKLKKEGKIVNTQGSKRLYVSSNFKGRETKEYGTLEKLVRSERTSYIIDYILNKSEVKVDDIKAYVCRRNTYDVALIADIINVLCNYSLICWDNEKEEYIIPDTTKVWYYTLKEDEGISRKDSAKKFGAEVNSAKFENSFREALKNGLIEIEDCKVYAILK